jgi:hypothetical protein
MGIATIIVRFNDDIKGKTQNHDILGLSLKFESPGHDLQAAPVSLPM